MNQPDTSSETDPIGEATDSPEGGSESASQAPAPSDTEVSDPVDVPHGSLSQEAPEPPVSEQATEGEATLDPVETAAVVEAILFATSRSISISKIQQVGELPNRRVVKDAIQTLNQRYDEMGCAFRIESIAGGYQVLTREEYDDVVSRLFKVKSDSKLSSAAMETLSIIAYRQPIMRADIEAIRGVSSGEMVRKLMEKNLVKIVGRAEVLGRPMLYGTTTFFLEAFGLSSIEDLPRVDELRPRPEPILKDQPGADEDATAQDGAEASGESKDPQDGADGEENASLEHVQPDEGHPGDGDEEE